MFQATLQFAYEPLYCSRCKPAAYLAMSQCARLQPDASLAHTYVEPILAGCSLLQNPASAIYNSIRVQLAAPRKTGAEDWMEAGLGFIISLYSSVDVRDAYGSKQEATSFVAESKQDGSFRGATSAAAAARCVVAERRSSQILCRISGKDDIQVWSNRDFRFAIRTRAFLNSIQDAYLGGGSVAAACSSGSCATHEASRFALLYGDRMQARHARHSALRESWNTLGRMSNDYYYQLASSRFTDDFERDDNLARLTTLQGPDFPGELYIVTFYQSIVRQIMVQQAKDPVAYMAQFVHWSYHLDWALVRLNLTHKQVWTAATAPNQRKKRRTAVEWIQVFKAMAASPADGGSAASSKKLDAETLAFASLLLEIATEMLAWPARCQIYAADRKRVCEHGAERGGGAAVAASGSSKSATKAAQINPAKRLPASERLRMMETIHTQGEGSDFEQMGDSLDGNHPSERGDDCESLSQTTAIVWAQFKHWFLFWMARQGAEPALSPLLQVLGYLIANMYEFVFLTGTIVVSKQPGKKGWPIETKHTLERKLLAQGTRTLVPDRYAETNRPGLLFHIYSAAVPRAWMVQATAAVATGAAAAVAVEATGECLPMAVIESTELCASLQLENVGRPLLAEVVHERHTKHKSVARELPEWTRSMVRYRTPYAANEGLDGYLRVASMLAPSDTFNLTGCAEFAVLGAASTRAQEEDEEEDEAQAGEEEEDTKEEITFRNAPSLRSLVTAVSNIGSGQRQPSVRLHATVAAMGIAKQPMCDQILQDFMAPAQLLHVMTSIPPQATAALQQRGGKRHAFMRLSDWEQMQLVIKKQDLLLDRTLVPVVLPVADHGFDVVQISSSSDD